MKKKLFLTLLILWALISLFFLSAIFWIISTAIFAIAFAIYCYASQNSSTAPTVDIVPKKPSLDFDNSSASLKSSFPQTDEYGGYLYKVYESVNVCLIKNNLPDFEEVKRTFKLHTSVCFVQEPLNPYDNNAVAVCAGSCHIGYMYKGTLQDMTNDFLNRGDNVTGFISSVTDQKITIDIAFYKTAS